MADMGYRNPGPSLANPGIAPSLDRPRISWGAIWAGAFSFAAIWTVFGMLGMSIFKSTGTLTTPFSTGVSWGLGVWSIILTAIAMFVAGHVTAHLGNMPTRRDAVIAAQTMFGLSAAGVLLFLVLAGAGVRDMAIPYVAYAIRTAGWFGWLGVLLGWACAMAGAASSRNNRPLAGTGSARDIRTAA